MKPIPKRINTADALNGLFNVDIQDSEGNVLYQAPQDFDTETAVARK